MVQTLKAKESNWKNPQYRNRQIAGTLFALPAILGFLIFVITPMILSLYYSLTDFSVFKEKTTFLGFENYRKLLDGSDPFFYKSLKATLYFVVLNVPATIIFSFLLALLLNRNIKGRALFRGIFYMPSIIPIVASCMIWQYLLNPDLGLANSILKSLGLSKSMWLYDEKSVIPTVVLTNLWNCGSTMVIFLAGLQNIPRHYYEAVEVDGGNSLHKLIYITIPMVSPVLFYNAVMCAITSFQAFDKAYILTEGGPNNASLFFSYLIYREAFANANMSVACALGWVLFVITGVCSILLFKTSGKWVFHDGGGR